MILSIHHLTILNLGIKCHNFFDEDNIYSSKETHISSVEAKLAKGNNWPNNRQTIPDGPISPGGRPRGHGPIRGLPKQGCPGSQDQLTWRATGRKWKAAGPPPKVKRAARATKTEKPQQGSGQRHDCWHIYRPAKA
ncbi:hypothetical protein RF11_02224 [Thelohanellus kitauei]|uniref:Uncharacterized protein n=1 Tax=Thelohanellus kitauei TaxID=669202 RepID=A0A0C2M8U5_THEKT|nr:hypothetical protein RF11_02224 [Thelohanellus kitauei]